MRRVVWVPGDRDHIIAKFTAVVYIRRHASNFQFSHLMIRFCRAVLSTGGVAAARRGLFYGVWLGGVFGLFRNHVASLREQAQMAEEDERLAQVKHPRQNTRKTRACSENTTEG